MKREIENHRDVQLLVRSFYIKVLNDKILSPFFEHAIKNNWEALHENFRHYLFIENNILYPKAVKLERELKLLDLAD